MLLFSIKFIGIPILLDTTQTVKKEGAPPKVLAGLFVMDVLPAIHLRILTKILSLWAIHDVLILLQVNPKCFGYVALEKKVGGVFRWMCINGAIWGDKKSKGA